MSEREDSSEFQEFDKQSNTEPDKLLGQPLGSTNSDQELSKRLSFGWIHVYRPTSIATITSEGNLALNPYFLYGPDDRQSNQN